MSFVHYKSRLSDASVSKFLNTFLKGSGIRLYLVKVFELRAGLRVGPRKIVPRHAFSKSIVTDELVQTNTSFLHRIERRKGFSHNASSVWTPFFISNTKHTRYTQRISFSIVPHPSPPSINRKRLLFVSTIFFLILLSDTAALELDDTTVSVSPCSGTIP